MKVYVIAILVSLSLAAENRVFGQSSTVVRLETEFENDALTSQQLDAFELRALQKLNDLAGYVEVIGNDSLQQRLKNHASEQFIALFIDSLSTILFPTSMKVSRPLKVHELAKALTDLSFASVSVKVSEQKLLQHFEKRFAGKYTGVAQCFVEYTFYEKGGTVKPHVGIYYNVQLVLSKRAKQFGVVSKEIWEVNLGDIQRLE